MAPRLLFLAALLAIGCTCQSDADCPLDEQCSDGVCAQRTADTTPPSVSLTAPPAGTTASGGMTLTASASDARGVASVDFAVDGSVVASANGTPWTVTWDSGSVWNGPHTVTAIARDAAGNTATSAGVTVSVANYPGAA